MIQIGNILISQDIKEEFFFCDLEKCKGACCVEGDLGAPLSMDELLQIEDVVDVVKPYLPPLAVKTLEEEGPYLLDEQGDFSTTTVNHRECAFSFFDDRGILKCGIEQAWKDGKTDFRKPISCHLYPIRVVKLHDHWALNYSRWHICSDACTLGAKMGVPVYKFLKEALIRRFGEAFYTELERVIKQEND